MRNARRIAFAVALLQAGISAAAEQPVSAQDLVGHLDLAVPQSPAFTSLGVAPEKVVKSDDLRTVAVGLLHGVDPEGNLQSGIAFDVRPYLALRGNESTLVEYREERLVRILSTLQVSFATAAGQSDRDKADRQALAINIKPWRQHDPAVGTSPLEYEGPGGTIVKEGSADATIDGCYAAYLKKAAEAPEVFPGDAEGLAKAEADIAAKARLAIKKCLDPFKKRYWNAGALEIAIAGYHSSVEGFADDGSAAWVGWSYGIGRHSQVVARVSYSDNRLVAPKNANSDYTLIDETDAGLRFRFGSSKATVMLEGLWTRAKNPGAEDEYWRGTVGAEVMVLPDVWLQFAAGKAFGTDIFEDDPVYSAQLRLGFSKESLLNAN